MTQPLIRVLYANGTDRATVEPVIRAVARFHRYGVVDNDAPISRESLKGVKHAGFLDRIVSAEKPLIVEPTDYVQHIADIAFRRHIIGLGIVRTSMTRDEKGRSVMTSGIGATNTYAVVSTFHFTELKPELMALAIEATAVHELGHVFRGIEGHCETDNCVMRDDFITKVRKTAVDFCTACSISINNSICSLAITP